MSPLTDSQHRIVTALGTNCCVTSGAGCGKTRVLVARYIHLLEQDPDVPLAAVAAITFTEKAAAQMRDRIRDACRERVAEAMRDRDVVRLERWRQRLWDVDIAPINTIHGFCGSLLRQWPVEAGVDPNFAVLDDTQAAFLRQDVVAAAVERGLDADDADLLAVLEHFRLPEVRDVLEAILAGQREVLLRTAGPVMNRSDEEILRRLKGDVDERVFARLRATLESPEVRDAVRELARLGGEADDKRESVRREALAQVERLRQAHGADTALAAAGHLAEDITLRGGSAAKWPSKADLDAAKDALSDLRDAFEAALKDLPTFDPEVEREHLALARALYRTACRTIEAYEAAKRDRSALDFEDLQIRARDLLRDRPRVRDACRRHFRAVLVDELQDTNFLQFEIVELLATEGAGGVETAPLRRGALFAVGDPKQSIYRFRGAEVEVFDRARGRVPARGRQGLEASFRLTPGLAILVNHIFARLMGEDYEPVEGVAPQRGAAVAEVLHTVPTDQADNGFRAGEGHAAEARTLAARLEAIVSAGEVTVRDAETGEERPVRWGDVAILLRRTGQLHLYEEALEARGIPYYVVAGRGFYKQQEVLDVINLLRALEDPTDDLHLAGVLRSPMFAVSDEGLYRLKAAGPALHEALARTDALEGADAEDLRGLRRAARLLPQWRRLKDRLTLADLVEHLVFDSGYAASAVGRFGGSRAYANLRRMVELAREFERGGLAAVADYVQYVTDVMQSEMQAEQAPVEVPGSDTVRIMTIHKAKGLEFPVVVLPDLAYAPRRPSPPWMIHPSAGLAVRLRDEAGDRVTSAAMALARADEADALRAEDRRLFYVAVTRAQRYLLLSSHEPFRSSGGETPWLDDLLEALGMERGSAGDERTLDLDPAAQVRVTFQAPPSHEPSRGRRRAGPRDVFAEGRVRWDNLHQRAGKGARKAADRLAQVGGAGVPPTPPRTVSVTALAAYRACPHRYWWNEVQGLRSVSPERAGAMDPRDWGTLAHRALELATAPDADACRGAVEAALRDAPPEADRDDLRRRLLDALDAFRAGPLGRRVADARTVHRELPFVLAVDGTAVRGKMDLLLETADGQWEVVDYKTGRPPAGDGADVGEAYALQLGLYALAAERWLGRAPARAAVYFLDHQDYRHRTVTPTDMEQTVETVREILACIAHERYHTANDTPCAGCDLGVVCAEAVGRNQRTH
jgi:ATP-dependent helicase/nuclease subunit A